MTSAVDRRHVCGRCRRWFDLQGCPCGCDLDVCRTCWRRLYSAGYGRVRAHGAG